MPKQSAKPRLPPAKGSPLWAEQLDADFAWATRALLDQGGLEPVFILHSRDCVSGDAVSGHLTAEWEDADEFQNIMGQVAMRSHASDTFAITHIAEAWGRTMLRPTEEAVPEFFERAGAEFKADPPNSSDLDVLMVILVYRDANDKIATLGQMATITRNATNEPIAVVPLPDDGMACLHPAIEYLKFAVCKRTPAERERAQKLLAATEAEPAYA